MLDEINPDWNVDRVKSGNYIWALNVLACAHRDFPGPKPYLAMTFQVTTGEQKGFKFSARLYFTPAAEHFCRYFLKKFGYPEELLTRQPRAVLRMSAIEGLGGKALLAVEVDNQYGVKADLKLFERLDETEIEDRIDKKTVDATLPGKDEPVIDVEKEGLEEPVPEPPPEEERNVWD